MEKKLITPEQKEKVSNRLVTNFGILLAGALVMLYVYNFVAANYIKAVTNVMLVFAIIFFITTVLTFALGFKKFPKLFKFWPVSLGAFIACAIPAYTKFTMDFRLKSAVLLVFILMAVYFIVIAVYTAIYLGTHKVIVEKKNITHKKKRK